MNPFAKNLDDLLVYQNAFVAATEVFQISKTFPREERYSMVDQLRRSSRSVCANLAEAWRKRRYKAAFIAKLSDAESEASETLTWIEFALRFEYIDCIRAAKLRSAFNQILSQLVKIIESPDNWLIR